MKILFAVNNEKISETIIKKFQQEYKEIILGKNVYYFNAIAKELQKDKSYDRIIISEDLEPFANNNFEVIDKFIFEKLDNISDEATSNDGQDIPIILICADRRTKSEPFLVKIFGIGVYSALLGSDRSIDKVCELINKPRTKKEAKVYYRVDSDEVDYKVESEGDVSEVELNNILNHYKSLGKNEEKYVESFDNIAAQYTDAQLRVICKFLPLNVKAVLEGNSQKYQELVTFGTVTPSSSDRGKGKKQQEPKYVPNSDYLNSKNKRLEVGKKDILERDIGKSNLTKPIIIPGGMNAKSVNKQESIVPETKDAIPQMPNNTSNTLQANDIDSMFEDFDEVQPKNEPVTTAPKVETNISEPVMENETVVVEEPKKRRGRPKKIQTVEEQEAANNAEEAPKKKRGRPKKEKSEPEQELSNVLPGIQEEETVNLFDLGNDEDSNQNVNTNTSSEMILPGFDDDDEEVVVKPIAEEEVVKSIAEEEVVKPIVEKEDQVVPNPVNEMQHTRPTTVNQNNYMPNHNAREIENTNMQYYDVNLDSLLSGNKKVVAFVGTSKNGTSFLVNNLADVLSKKGINVAVLDLTQNKNAYYIYTKNEEELRKKAYSSIQNLAIGDVDGIQVNKNLTVFTTLPGEDEGINEYGNILKTLVQNYSVVLMDCDFETNYGYFKNAQEIYLVQSFDILTIQPLTAFLRNLKSKNILEPQKLRVVLNKVLRVRSVTERTIIGGMAYYNDPAMSFMTELFDKDNIKYCSIPFEEQTYSRYLEGLVNCEISVNGYSKNFLASLDKLSNMVYPLLSNNANSGKLNSYNSNVFSSDMNNTLNKMKNNY